MSARRIYTKTPAQHAGSGLAIAGVTARPPLVAGVETASWWVARRFTWWSIRGFAYSMRKKGIPLGTRIFSGIMGAITTAPYPIFVLIMDQPSRAARIYMTCDDGRPTATLRVTARPGNVWSIADHRSRTPGSNGYGRALRNKLLGALRDEADRRGITIKTIAASKGLAEIYKRELDGLEDVGWAIPRGRKLRRLPRPTRRPNHFAVAPQNQ